MVAVRHDQRVGVEMVFSELWSITVKTRLIDYPLLEQRWLV
jgi:hypothetical protein